jgi:lysozyme family protein
MGKTKTWTYEASQMGYADMWSSIVIKGGADAANAHRFGTTIIAHEAIYREVEAAMGIPWYFVGALHMRESSCNFNTHLHNGDSLKARTRHVPKGYPKKGKPPFTWVESAIDALRLKGVEKYRGQWCPALFAWFSEIYNGLGYVAHGVHSPYDWAGSNHEEHGKYVSDHVWDKNFDDPQIGTMTVLKELCYLRKDIASDMGHAAPGMSLNKKITIGGTGVTATAAIAANAQDAVPDASNTIDTVMPIITMFQNYGGLIACVFTVALVLGAVGLYFYEKSQAVPDAVA